MQSIFKGSSACLGIRRSLLVTHLLLSTSLLLSAGEPTKKEGLRYGFSEPKVLKLDWSTRALQVADLNQDGLSDLALINNDSAQIELLYQRSADLPAGEEKQAIQRDRWEPLLGDAPFDSEKVTVGFPMFDLAVGDMNGDGRVDMAYTSRDAPLTVRLQNDEGQWVESQEFGGFESLGWHSTLEIADIDGDGRMELILLAADAVRIFASDASGEINEKQVYYLTGNTPFNLQVFDLTGDGLAEICYVTSDGKQSLVMREQLASGGFGAERRFVLARSIRMFAPIEGSEGRASQLAMVESRSGVIEFVHIHRTVQPEGRLALEGVQPQIYSIFRDVKEGARYAFGDLDGNGAQDLQVANPDGSELMVFMREEGRFLVPNRFPTFSAIASLGAGRFFESESESIIALSEQEGTLGISQMDSRGRVTFPRLIDLDSGDPIVSEVIDLDQDGYDEIAVIYESKSVRKLVIGRPVDRVDFGTEWEVLSTTELPNLRRAPNAIRALDIFGEKGPGLMLFIPREAPLLLTSMSADASEHGLELVGASSGVRESLLKGAELGQISEIDVDGDGFCELVVARDGYARAVRFVEDRFEMVDQYNARRSDDTVAAVVPSFNAEGLEGLALYIADKGELQFLRRDEDGVFRYSTTDELGSMNLSGWTKFESSSQEDDAYVLYGDDRFWYFSDGEESWTQEIGESFETELKDVYFSYVVPADFDADGQLDLVAVDGNEHVVEVLSRDGAGVRSEMFWEVFEQNMNYQGRKGGKIEPREAVSADLNGDGRLDFAFLIHDRIIYYLQE